MTMLSMFLLVSGMFLLTNLKVNMSELGSKDRHKALSIGRSSRSKFTIFGDKFPGDISFKMSQLLEINFAQWKLSSFKRASTSVMVFTAVCGSSKESR